MAILLSPIGNSVHYIDSNGDPLLGAQLFVYIAGSSTKATTFKDDLGTSSNTNPIILDGSGATPFPVWLTSGIAYKFILAPATDIDPPTAAIWSIDNVVAINDSSVSLDQWIVGPQPTFVTSTSFSLAGDQTINFHVGRRVKMSQTSGSAYGTIINSVFLTVTDVTVALDSGVIDVGLSTVWYGFLTSDNHAVPFGSMYTAIGDILYASAPSVAKILPIGDDGQILIAGTGIAKVPEWWVPAGYKNGLIISPDAGDTARDVNITAGEAADSDAGYIMKLTNEITKQLDNPWAVGDNGGGNFTALTADTWYHVFIIRKDSDGTIDAGFDTSLTAANIPAGYTAYLRIGSVITDASSDMFQFKQYKDRFVLTPAIVNSTNGTARSQLETVTSPIDVQTIAHLQLRINSTGSTIYLSDADRGDDTITLVRSAGSDNSVWVDAVTNTDSQIWININVGAPTFEFNSIGWTELW